VHRTRLTFAGTTVAVLTLVAAATASGAQQLVDASEKGDVAFDIFAGMCILFVILLFAIDRVRGRD
jgi:hypothetical protein